MTNHMQNAIEAATQTRMEQNECAHTISNLECDMHGELFVITDYADIYGHLMPTGYCPIARQEAEDIIDAALPHLRKMIAQEIMAYLDDFPSHGLIYRDGVWAGVHSAARIAKGPQK